MRIKICGITQPDQGRAIVELEANLLGFICVPASPRYVTPAQIQAVLRECIPWSESVIYVGVFANESLENIATVLEQTSLSGIQLHGNEPPSFCQQIKQLFPHREVIKALRIRTPQDLDAASIYGGAVDTLLLDAYHPQLLGGTGQTLNWSILADFNPGIPWFLAGGLTPENVGEALTQIQPDGVDVSSGVEQSPGHKDLKRVKQFISSIQLSLC